MAYMSKSVLITVVADRIVELSGWEGRAGIVYHLMTTKMTYLRTLRRILNNEDDLSKLVAQYVSQGAPEDKIREMIHFVPKLEISDVKKASSLAFGLKTYHHLNPIKDVTYLDEAEEAQCLALMRVTNAIDSVTSFSFPSTEKSDVFKIMQRGDHLIGMPYKFGGKSRRLKDPEMIEFVLQHVDEVDRIVSLIEGKGVMEPRVLRAALEGIRLPLAEGSL